MAGQNLTQITNVQSGSMNTGSIFYTVFGGQDYQLPASVLVNNIGLTGVPTSTTATVGTNTTQIATTAFVQAQNTATLAAYAPLAGATFTGPVIIPTVTISGGTISGTAISGSTGSFTNLTASGTVSGAGFTTLLNPYATLASPTFIGTVTIPSGASIAGYAPLASPALTGTPTAPTAAASTNTTQLATTAFVQAALPAATWTTYTPTLTALAGTYTTATATGGYAKVGNLIIFWATATITTVGTGTNPVLGLPFATATGGNNIVITGREVSSTGSLVQGVTGSGQSTMTIWDYKNTNIAASGTSFQMSGCYLA